MTSDDITEAFNRALIDSGPLGARRVAAKEIARMARLEDRLRHDMDQLTTVRARILALAGETGNPVQLVHAAAQCSLAIAHLEEWRDTNV
jgi:hypothetical protein